MKNLKSGEQVERVVILKLLKNKELQDKFLPTILTGTFLFPVHRMIIFAMRQLHKRRIQVTANNILLFLLKEKEAYFFKKKYNYDIPDADVYRQFMEYGLETSEWTEELFEDFYKLHLEYAFRRYVDKRMNDIKWFNENKLEGSTDIVIHAQAIINLYEKFFKVQIKKKAGIRETAEKVNEGNSFYPTSSQSINNIMYGWSKGYPDSILARSGHGKSSFITSECRHKIRKNLVEKAAVITTEEAEPIFWQRMFALECGLSLEGMRQGLVKIADSHVKVIEKLYGNRIQVFEELKFGKVVELLFSLSEYKFIVVDHINAIDYPGRGMPLQNMPGGIAKLITHEKNFLSGHSDTVIINVNQVKEKDLPQIRSHWKEPSYEMAYGSSTTYFAAREWLTFYHPYKDMINRPQEWLKVKTKPEITDLWCRVQKSSFGQIGRALLHWEGDYATLTDTKRKSTKTEFTAPQEEFNYDEIIGTLK